MWRREAPIQSWTVSVPPKLATGSEGESLGSRGAIVKQPGPSPEMLSTLCSTSKGGDFPGGCASA